MKKLLVLLLVLVLTLSMVACGTPENKTEEWVGLSYEYPPDVEREVTENGIVYKGGADYVDEIPRYTMTVSWGEFEPNMLDNTAEDYYNRMVRHANKLDRNYISYNATYGGKNAKVITYTDWTDNDPITHYEVFVFFDNYLLTIFAESEFGLPNAEVELVQDTLEFIL